PPRGLPFSTFESNVSMTTSPPAMACREAAMGHQLFREGGWCFLDVEDEGDDSGNQDRRDRRRDDGQTAQDSDIIGPDGHVGDLAIQHVDPEGATQVIPRTRIRCSLEDGLQLREESPPRLPLLGDHPSM